ncbi:MAG: hypothetical protein EZS28_005717 [Streblomastix strix]|uniref:Exoribonuclease phosphorolytic domain-containing protein n=1 Tax=Streblomastix strix TaxID=222440 RepID=A0A5J4WUP5_9EUKA|nr:MAG: hypothetical protein EZS28_005717 [Streblomastix strix]
MVQFWQMPNESQRDKKDRFKGDELRVRELMEKCIDTRALPNTLITIAIQILNENGSLLSCILNGATLALIDSGIPMLYTPCSSSVALLEYNSNYQLKSDLFQHQLIKWPILEQEKKSYSTSTVTFTNVDLDAVVFMNMVGEQILEETIMNQIFGLAREGAKEFIEHAKESLMKKPDFSR